MKTEIEAIQASKAGSPDTELAYLHYDIIGDYSIHSGRQSPLFINDDIL